MTKHSPAQRFETECKVQAMIYSGLTYREVAAEMGFKSTSAVARYADGKHLHRLRDADADGLWKCIVCKKCFMMIDSGEQQL